MTNEIQTVVTNTSSPAVHLLEIPISAIQESPTNPRRQFDEIKLAELADFVPGNKIGVMWPSRLCGIRTR